MTSVIYVSLSAFIIGWLSLNVIKQRRKHHISIGDGGVDDLKIAMAIQSNAVEYIPISLILILSLEYNNANIWLVHSLGVLFLLSRFIHPWSILTENLKWRVISMQITFYTIIALAVLNIIYLPLSQLIK